MCRAPHPPSPTTILTMLSSYLEEIQCGVEEGTRPPSVPSLVFLRHLYLEKGASHEKRLQVVRVLSTATHHTLMWERTRKKYVAIRVDWRMIFWIIPGCCCSHDLTAKRGVVTHLVSESRACSTWYQVLRRLGSVVHYHVPPRLPFHPESTLGAIGGPTDHFISCSPIFIYVFPCSQFADRLLQFGHLSGVLSEARGQAREELLWLLVVGVCPRNGINDGSSMFE